VILVNAFKKSVKSFQDFYVGLSEVLVQLEVFLVVVYFLLICVKVLEVLEIGYDRSINLGFSWRLVSEGWRNIVA